MAKKKHRHKRHKNSSRLDKHHLLWLRSEWSSGEQKRLRNYYYCIIPLPKDSFHHHIHTRVSCIPLPKSVSAQYVFEHLKYLTLVGAIKDSDPIEKRLKLLINLFDYIEPATAAALYAQLKAVYEYNNTLSK